MALYDDLDSKQPDKVAEKVAGWTSSGIKLMQSQMQLKKVAQPKQILRKHTVLAPVINLKTKKEVDGDISLFGNNETATTTTTTTKTIISTLLQDYNWNVEDEYDPLWPNDYEKLVKEKREKKEKPREERKRQNNRANDEQPPQKTSFSGGKLYAEEEEEFRSFAPPSSNSSRSRDSTYIAVAPPPSLDSSAAGENLKSSSQAASNYGTGSVAAKIMAKYGFKDGQGLGKQEQGMSVALQVEKTSKRGGRIVHEKDLMSFGPPPAFSTSQSSIQVVGGEPSITEIMKSPSKIVLLRNMVGPGDVDNDLEPEVKDECNTKYGDVLTVVIHEVKNVHPEDAVRIFVEFKRIESAIKAVVDLNGRFFGGRQVKAGFFSAEKFQHLHFDEYGNSFY